MQYGFFCSSDLKQLFLQPFFKRVIISNLNVILIKTDDEKLFSTSLLILAGMLLLLGGCKEDELPVSGEGNVANNELPVRLAETDYNPGNTYYLLNDNESQDVIRLQPAQLLRQPASSVRNGRRALFQLRSIVPDALKT